MNSFEIIKAAREAIYSHVCGNRCSRNSEGYCFTKIQLWQHLHRVASHWNAGVQ